MLKSFIAGDTNEQTQLALGARGFPAPGQKLFWIRARVHGCETRGGGDVKTDWGLLEKILGYVDPHTPNLCRPRLN